MPTPFTHLEAAQRLLADETIAADLRAPLQADLGAFLLGSVAADARADAKMGREITHFFVYDELMDQPAWRTMLRFHPALKTAVSQAQRAFLAGYVAHLAMDEVWTVHMLTPHFAGREWAPRPLRFLMLHVLLIYMDERDYGRLLPWQPAGLASAQPYNWLPFLSDSVLCGWRDFIGEQIRPGGISQTLAVFGERIGRTSDQLRAILDSPEQMQSDLWQHIPPALLADIEGQMMAAAREQMALYLNEYPC